MKKFKIITLLFVVVLMFNTTTFVFGKDVNAGGNDGFGGTSKQNGPFRVRSNPINGMRVMVFDTTKGREPIKVVNFVSRMPDTKMMYFLSKGWKGLMGKAGITESELPMIVDPTVPDSNDNKLAWFESDDTLKRLAHNIGMTVDENPPKIQTDPNVLNQQRYKVVTEPLVEAYIGTDDYVVFGTVCELYNYIYIDLKYKDQFLLYMGGYMSDVANSIHLIKNDDYMHAH